MLAFILIMIVIGGCIAVFDWICTGWCNFMEDSGLKPPRSSAAQLWLDEMAARRAFRERNKPDIQININGDNGYRFDERPRERNPFRRYGRW